MKKNIFICAIIGMVLFLFSANLYAQSDFDTIKKRILEEMMKPRVDDSELSLTLNSIRNDGTWPGIDYVDVSNEGFQHSRHLSNMVALARAYNLKSSEHHKSKQVKDAIELALKHWVDNDYICENWWHNQIGTPDNLVRLMLLIGDDLPKELVDKAQPIIGRAHIDAPGARPGGDRIKIAGIQAKNMLFTGDRQTFEKVVNVIENEIKYVEWIGRKYGYTFRFQPGGFANREAGGRGIQYGNSFHHREDGVNNTLSYGIGYADAFIEWTVYTAGTQYQFAGDKLERLVDYFLDGICKTAVFGKFPDAGATNRDVSRPGALRPFGAQTAEKLMLTTQYRKKELQEISDIRKKGAKPTVSHSTFFWNTEHFTYQRPDWFTSVRMYSTRNYNMEQPYNSEGLLNHHRGDGANHVSRTGDEYFDIFPVFDYQKVPGATIMQKETLPNHSQIHRLGLTGFVGAVTDGKYGAATFDFKSPHDPLIARKSWFFFDDEYVCLGAGISCRQQLPVVTTLNQCLLRGDVTVSSGNQQSVIEKGEKQFTNVDWVFHDGIGYVFPEPASIVLMNKRASGSWWDISKQSTISRGKVEKDVFKLWIDHGTRPSDETYQYIVVPATSLEKMKQNVSGNNISVLANTFEIQAVNHRGLNISQIIFYQSGEVGLPGGVRLSSDTPGAVMIKTGGGKVTGLSVSDPSRMLGKMHLTISGKLELKGEGVTCVYDKKRNSTAISVVLPQTVYAGSSVTVK